MSDDAARWQQGMSVCPKCDAGYPDWHSPVGHTCPVCGHLPEYDANGERLWPADVPSRRHEMDSL